MVLENVTSESIAAAIISLAEGRFTLSDNNHLNEVLQDITPDSLTDKLVINLKRAWPNSVGKRTILITVLNCLKDFKTAIQWAASIKDELLEPENGDLYLFIVIKEQNLSVEQCTDIESSDRICRRYVLQPTESIEEFLSRSFIAPVMSDANTTGIADPLYRALEKTASKHEWFVQDEQQTWQEILLSGKTGRDLIESLFKL